MFVLLHCFLILLYWKMTEQKRDTWQARRNQKACELYQKFDVVAIVKKTRLQWLWHKMRIGEDKMPKNILIEKPGGYRRVGRFRLRWLDDVMTWQGLE